MNPSSTQNNAWLMMNKLHSQRWKKSRGAAPTKYPLYLPTEAELKHELEQERMKVQSLLMQGASEK